MLKFYFTYWRNAYSITAARVKMFNEIVAPRLRRIERIRSLNTGLTLWKQHYAIMRRKNAEQAAFNQKVSDLSKMYVRVVKGICLCTSQQTESVEKSTPDGHGQKMERDEGVLGGDIVWISDPTSEQQTGQQYPKSPSSHPSQSSPSIIRMDDMPMEMVDKHRKDVFSYKDATIRTPALSVQRLGESGTTYEIPLFKTTYSGMKQDIVESLQDFHIERRSSIRDIPKSEFWDSRSLIE
ncbi:hypothetical protein ADUPG1_009872 [Aduncisulcus paluster]|uniref:Uncharacterized protein n=1 Tax=Aduncisulcus paluster TaxID=2918883 RepID=A0ABQ5KX35_9EUKA|nr:hypothetical protein ADUPG1_009872 [Aduncisulcus paluster]